MAKKTEAIITLNGTGGPFTVTLKDNVLDANDESYKVVRIGQNGYYHQPTKTYYPPHRIDSILYVETPIVP